MALSWNEIKSRAVTFSKEWVDESSEDAEAKTFLDEFFNVFGISRKRVGSFEKKVKTLDGKTGYMDMLWKGQILIEMKSRGKNLDRAYKQATDYFAGLTEIDLPKYILVCDFQYFRLYDLEEGTEEDFELKELYKKVKLFGFIAGYQKKTYKAEDPVNIEAAELMGQLHDELKSVGYTGHQLEIYLVRLLFCLFSDDTSIFDKNIFQEFIENKTRPDGSDVGSALAQLFQVLNTDVPNRMKTLDEDLAAFPYVNGKLFEEPLQLASWNSHMRIVLLKCCGLNWGAISPAIFGSMFQSVMNDKARRNLGAHYTSEKNILKLIKPLFLDELWGEFENLKNDKNKVINFHKKVSSLKFLDPACGCGNFLVISYREIRLLELEVLKQLIYKFSKVAEGTELNVSGLVQCDVDQFYGIEYEEFPAQIAQVAMWLMDHQMNMKVSEEFGNYYRRLPLKKSPTIVNGNALRVEWQSLIQERNRTYNYILGNPPFIGKALMNEDQKKDIERIFSQVKGAGVLDYVTCWYICSAQYLKQWNNDDLKIKCAFVSTNSISQGEQVGILWNELFNKYHLKIHFAHRTFCWSNEAKGNAAVHVVIIGFSNFDVNEKVIYEYDDIKGEAHAVKAVNINPYLVEGREIVINKRRTPICRVPEISFGSMPNDGGYLLLSNEEKTGLLKSEPEVEKFIRPILSAYEFLNGQMRWCIWLKNIPPNEWRGIKELSNRIEHVRKHRTESSRPSTQKLASFPTLFGEDRQPNSDYILIPRHSSENRNYIPMGFFDKNYIVSDSCLFIADAKRYHFGILTSIMHMTWVKFTCGRIKSDFRYSNETVYNNYPWPENPSEKQKDAVEKAAQKVLDVRAEFTNSSLADLYDPISMPPALVKAHQDLDRAVDLCYRPQPFINETKRIELLFELYDKYTSGLFKTEKKSKRKVKV